MGLYIYVPAIRPGTQELIDLIQAKRLHRFDGMHFWYKNNRLAFNKNDTILCWGRCLPPMEPQRILNSNLTISDYVNVFSYVYLLERAGLYAIRPAKDALFPTSIIAHPLDTIKRQRDSSSRTIHSPDTFSNGFRQTVCLVPMLDEYELHVFNNKIIYARTKVATLPIAKSEDAWMLNKDLAHPWYKSTMTGWKTVPYDCDSSFLKSNICEVTLKLMKQTGLLFGVTYIGRMVQSPTYTVFRKTSLTPDLDTDTVKIYAERILEHVENKG